MSDIEPLKPVCVEKFRSFKQWIPIACGGTSSLSGGSVLNLVLAGLEMAEPLAVLSAAAEAISTSSTKQRVRVLRDDVYPIVQNSGLCLLLGVSFFFFVVVDGVVDVASSVSATTDNCGELVCWSFMNFDMLNLSLSWMCLR